MVRGDVEGRLKGYGGMILGVCGGRVGGGGRCFCYFNWTCFLDHCIKR